MAPHGNASSQKFTLLMHCRQRERMCRCICQNDECRVMESIRDAAFVVSGVARLKKLAMSVTHSR